MSAAARRPSAAAAAPLPGCRVWALASLAVLVTASAAAQEVPGLVTRVMSGDRLEFRSPNSRIPVQLADVAAPRTGEPLADASRSALADLCYSQAATLAETGTATDGTTLGHVTCAGRNAAQEQVRRGMATVRPEILAKDSVMQDALNQAKRARRGLWADR